MYAFRLFSLLVSTWILLQGCADQLVKEKNSDGPAAEAASPIHQILTNNEESAQIQKPTDPVEVQARAAWDEANIPGLKDQCDAGNPVSCKALAASKMRSTKVAKDGCDNENAFACEVADVLAAGDANSADIDRLEYVCGNDKAVTGQIACSILDRAKAEVKRQQDLADQARIAEEKRVERARVAAEQKYQRIVGLCASRHAKACEELANAAYANRNIDESVSYANLACTYGSKSACDFRNVVIQERNQNQQADREWELHKEQLNRQAIQNEYARQQLLLQQAALMQQAAQESAAQQQRALDAFAASFRRPQPPPRLNAHCVTNQMGQFVYTDCE